MADEEKNTNQDAFDGFSFEMFIGDDGAEILNSEKLSGVNKKLPDWEIVPPGKYED